MPLSLAPAPFPPPLRSCVPISPSTVCQRSLRAAPVQACAMPYEVRSGWSHPIGRPSLQNHLDTPCGFLVDASVLALRRLENALAFCTPIEWRRRGLCGAGCVVAWGGSLVSLDTITTFLLLVSSAAVPRLVVAIARKFCCAHLANVGTVLALSA